MDTRWFLHRGIGGAPGGGGVEEEVAGEAAFLARRNIVCPYRDRKKKVKSTPLTPLGQSDVKVPELAKALSAAPAC